MILLFIIPLFLSANPCFSEMRKPAVAGQFYPADKAELYQMVSSFIKEAAVNPPVGQLKAIIVPHAGYVFSGKVAAYGFKLLKGKKIDTVILLGSSHNEYLNKAAVFNGDGFNTPLGDVAVDKEFVSGLLNSVNIFIEANTKPHLPEHSLEVELPFLQSVIENFEIVPILINNQNLEDIESIAKTIAFVINKQKNKRIILVISSDMSHYPDYETANIVDRRALDSLKHFEPAEFVNTAKRILNEQHENLSCVFCGESAVLAGMYIAKMIGANDVQLLKYSNSGDVPVYGDKSRVVGYSAVAFTMKSTKQENIIQHKKGVNMPDFSVSENNQHVLLDLARRTIKEYIRTKKIFVYTTSDKDLLNPSAVFVTLNKNHQLRGCIGTTIPQLPLYQAVQQMAIAAATEDYRFGPVVENEVRDIKIEISVLSPITRVKSADEIKQNTHGVVVRKGNKSGLFLPQVWEHFSTKEEFMSELCYQKAGLHPDSWKNSDTELYVFTVFAFEEK